MNDVIEIRGAREHNLKNLHLRIPRGKMVVITGLSGSGKSSLAFDTLYAEGQRRYVESLSAYARQFLEQMDKPDVDAIEGLSPAIAIEQKTTSKNPRSTVGTVTEIYDYLRVLYARVGSPHCIGCGKSITSQTITQMTDRLMELGEGARVTILSPVVRDRKGHYQALFEELRKAGFLRVNVDGELRELDEEIELDKFKKHTIEVVIDRVVVRDDARPRIAEALELAVARADGLALAEVKGGERMLFSENFSCSECNISLPELSPRAFSFNSPHGACTECDGLGTSLSVDPVRLVAAPEKSIADGAIVLWLSPTAGYLKKVMCAVVEHYNEDPKTPWNKLSEKVKRAVLYGTGEDEVSYSFESKRSTFKSRRAFEGIVPRIERKIREASGEDSLDALEPFLEVGRCKACAGARLRPESLSVTLGGLPINELTALSVIKARKFFTELSLGDREMQIARRVFKEILDRLGFMEDVGLGYLTLDRASGSLSGGESQRIRLATQVGSRLTGVLYILDEPTIGLHPRDNQRLLETLKELRDLGNSVIMVEHDEETIREADYVIDMGPGAGDHGGCVVAQGTPEEIEADPASITGAYLSGRSKIAIPEIRRKANGNWLELTGAKGNNLKGVDLKIPLGTFTCVTGVSGSGKSSLVIDTLLAALTNAPSRSGTKALEYDRLIGAELVDKVVDVNQAPIGRTPRSNPATYTGLFTPVRDLFAKLPEAQVRGFGKGRFSFNVKGGRCEACKGDGMVKIEMHFLPDVYVHCEECNARRYNRETLSVHYKGASIADVLEMTVSHALELFRNVPTIRPKLQTLEMVGLGYIRLGQASTTLSGGEAQRIKLAKELSRRATGRTLYVLDEPTTGLHFEDVKKLLEVLDRLVEAGNTVVVIEHNTDVVKTADHVIDLGPDGGEAGGRILVSGTPEEVAACKASYTGGYLRPLLKPGKAKSSRAKPGKKAVAKKAGGKKAVAKKSDDKKAGDKKVLAGAA